MTDITGLNGGIYISKFQAGVASTLIATALIGGFGNIWYLNTKAIQYDSHVADMSRETATLPGALSRAEWEIERRLITTELKAINGKLDDLKTQMAAQ